ncbi:MAG TPA: methyltransferase domain-containing protein [Pirellulales bacterium]|jgi:2-polyprenyl-3-methyl-5-hydroxy-6-metoxy-1,4-benzoquinol methylase|nr:methyltransferase domain-containing protein [Pirellulales bacterium]
MNDQPIRPVALGDLARRNRQPEIMDQPELDPARHLAALGGLAQVNWFSRSVGIVWGPIRRLARRLQRPGSPPSGALRVLDLASGGGDVAIALARRARRHRLALEIVGYDRSSTAVEYARSRAADLGVAVRFEVRDVLAQSWDGPFDVVMCSLFLHHLDEPQASDLLDRMARTARHLVLVNDLSRSRLGYLVAQVACRTITRSDVVRVDGPLSVAAAFRPCEAEGLARRAGLQGARVRRRWPFRFLLTWEPTS